MLRIITVLCLLCIFNVFAHSQNNVANVDSLVNLIGVYQGKANAAAMESDYDSAIHWECEVLKIVENTLGKESQEYALTLGLIAGYLNSGKVYGRAFYIAKLAFDIMSRCTDEHDDNYVMLSKSLEQIKTNTINQLTQYRAKADSAVNGNNAEEAIRWGKAANQLVKDTGEMFDYAISLNQLSIYYSYGNDYRKAIALATQAIDVLEKSAVNDSLNYKTMTDNLNYYRSMQTIYEYNLKADLAAVANDYTTAIRCKTESLEIIKSTSGTKNAPYILSLNDLGLYNFNLGKYGDAIRYVEEAIKLQKETFGGDNNNYATFLDNLSQYKAALGDYNAAIDITGKALDIQSKLQGENSPAYARILRNLSKYYYAKGEIRKAVDICSRALDIQSNTIGKEHLEYSSSLNELARYESSLGNNQEAIRLAKESLDIRRKINGENNLNYCIGINNLSQYYYNIGNYPEAISLEKNALDIMCRIFGEEYHENADFLNNLALYYTAIGDYEEAINLNNKALEIKKRVFGTKHPSYLSALSNLSHNYYKMGDYSKAIDMETEAIKRMKEVLGENHPDYMTMLCNLALYNDEIGEYRKAIELYNEVLRLRKKVIGEKHPEYAKTLSNLGITYFSLGDIQEAIRLTKQAADIQKEIFGEEHPDYATSLNNLGLYYRDLKDYQKSFDYLKQALDTQKRLLGDTHPDLARTYYNIALLNEVIGGNDTTSVKLINAGLSIYKKNDMESHIDYAKLLGLLSNNMYRQGKYEDAIKLKKAELNGIKNSVGDKHITYIDALSLLAYFYVQLQDPQAAATCEEVTQSLTAKIRETFAYLTNKERTHFWKKESYWFNTFINQVAYLFPSDSNVINAYNGLLLSKGLLLNSEIELRTLLAESGDKEVETLYSELKLLRNKLNKLYELPIAERQLDTDSLENESRRMERELVKRSKTYGDFTSNLCIDWKQVQQHLGTRDAAIEFVSFPAGADSVMYAAYCLRPGMESPRLYTLFEEKQLKSVKGTKSYITTDVAGMVWKPLADELQNVDRVYFAPDGELYNIAIESVPHWDGTGLVSDRWQFNRLSSTRQLALSSDDKSVDKAVLYGGLRYDTDMSTMVNDSRKYPVVTRSFDIDISTLSDSLNLRGGLQHLPATLVEAEEIEKYIRKTNILPTLYTDTVGTEGSFKALSGGRTRLIHVATHGFYWTQREVQTVKNLPFLSMQGMEAYNEEDKAMTRSGLFFAGANNLLEGKHLPENVEDGILTAREISALDLRGLDLVVLSACQTGLGEISGDGVFGLQRGFKKAGAKSLLMSLWKVDDKATQMLMTRFYANLVAGKGKAESLRDAQKYVREYEVQQTTGNTPDKRILSANAKAQAEKEQKKSGETRIVRPYSDPKFWAAFILLDGINGQK